MASPRKLTAVVVGGSSGIGLSTVKLFLKKGVQPLIADINEEKGKEAQAELKTLGHDVSFVKLDITDNDSVQAGIKEAADALGVIDIAVNTAGVTGPMCLVHELSDEQYHKIMKVDMEGCFKFQKYMIQYFRAQEPRQVRHDKGIAWEPVMQRGSLVNIASSLSTVAQPLLGVYCAAKAGVVLLSKAAALENAELGIRVNIISPGLTYTPLLRNDPGFDINYATKHFLKDQPINRFGHPDEIAAGIVFTAMDTGSFMTGTNWGPDGGYQIQ